ncbi:hypothetical protein ACE6H2_024013 [Prunus campanulata]
MSSHSLLVPNGKHTVMSFHSPLMPNDRRTVMSSHSPLVPNGRRTIMSSHTPTVPNDRRSQNQIYTRLSGHSLARALGGLLDHHRQERYHRIRVRMPKTHSSPQPRSHFSIGNLGDYCLYCI